MDRQAPESGVITAIERQKASRYRYNIFIDEQFAFSVHEDIMIKHRLLKGETVEREAMGVIVQDDERHQAYLEAIRYIGRRPRALNEVKLHLKHKGYEPEQIAETVARLQAEGYLNDEAFAKLWTEHRIMTQRKGRRWVQMELSQKGVEEESISAALSGIDPEEEYLGALEAGAKKWRITSGETAERKQKVMVFLMRRGYSGELANRIIRRLEADSED